MVEVTKRSTGTTPSEQYLANLADRSFLNLWSYPNLYRNQKLGPSGDGKELCDLLVVCGDHVVIFSDKTISWPPVSDVGLAWSRWFRNAIQKSVKQVRGAERWISEYPDRIFLDKECTQKLPIELPTPDRRKMHGVIVALGAGEACRKYFSGGSGSLMIRPSVIGQQHVELQNPTFEPFVIGDVHPNGSFIHVLDDATLDVVMRELDTISDFTDYLTKKAAFARSGRLIQADGEEDLVAYYATRLNDDEEHDFTHPDRRPWQPGETLVLGGGHYADFIRNPRYIAKKEADKVSYVWDRLIEAFTRHMLAGTTIVPPGKEFSLKDIEQCVRYMALEPRFRRRHHGEAILGALEEGKKGHRFCRMMLPDPQARQNETGFFFLTFEYLQHFEENGGYDEYRRIRALHLEAYGLGILRQNRYLKRVVGIATEPPGAGKGSSEDAILIEPGEWTPEFDAEVQRQCEELDILRESRLRGYAPQGNEFPEVSTISFSRPAMAKPGLNRRERRRAKAKMKRASRKDKK